MEPSARWFVTRARIGDLDRQRYDLDDFKNFQKYVQEWTDQNAHEKPPTAIDISTWPEPELLDPDLEAHVSIVGHSPLLSPLLSIIHDSSGILKQRSWPPDFHLVILLNSRRT
jgi:hypothetical protein